MPGVTHREVAEFRRLYDTGRSITQVARMRSRSTDTVWRHLKRTGEIRSQEEGWARAKEEGRVLAPPVNRKWDLNEEVFDTLVPETAWALGLVYGDGYVDPERGRFLLACGRDEDLAEKVGAVLGWTGSPVYRNNCWMLEIVSKPLVRSLEELGVYRAKTYTMRFPALPEELLSHFVRGCWEADGTMSRLKTGRLFMKYTSASVDFVDSMQSVVSAGAGVRKAKIQSAREGDRSRSISWGTASADRLASWLYAPSEPHMRSDRKYSIWEGGQ